MSFGVANQRQSATPKILRPPHNEATKFLPRAADPMQAMRNLLFLYRFVVLPEGCERCTGLLVQRAQSAALLTTKRKRSPAFFAFSSSQTLIND